MKSHVLCAILTLILLTLALSSEASVVGKIRIVAPGSESFRDCIERLTRKLRPRTGFEAAQITGICKGVLTEEEFKHE